MFPSPVRSGLSLSKVIGGVSKTLNVANQIIPLYMQAKPMISNAKNAFKVAKEILNTPSSKNMPSKTKETPKKDAKKTTQKEEQPTIVSTNNPVFFL